MNERKGLEAGQKVALRLAVEGSAIEVDRASSSLAAACAFSGVGARARRMAGALSLTAAAASQPISASPADGPDDLAARLGRLLQPALARDVATAQYPIVAGRQFSAGVLKRSFQDWRQALETVGTAYRIFRQFEPGTQRRRRPDYDVAKGALQGHAPGPQTVTRAAFGLPITFRFRSMQGPGVQVMLPDSDRRGSPLLLTLERLAGGKLAVVWSLFRSQLTPDGQIVVGRATTAAPDLSIVDSMLRRDEWASHRIGE